MSPAASPALPADGPPSRGPASSAPAWASRTCREPLPVAAGQSIAGRESPGWPVPLPGGPATGVAGSEAQETGSGALALGWMSVTWAGAAESAAGQDSGRPPAGCPAPGSLRPGSVRPGSVRPGWAPSAGAGAAVLASATRESSQASVDSPPGWPAVDSPPGWPVSGSAAAASSLGQPRGLAAGQSSSPPGQDWPLLSGQTSSLSSQVCWPEPGQTFVWSSSQARCSALSWPGSPSPDPPTAPGSCSAMPGPAASAASALDGLARSGTGVEGPFAVTGHRQGAQAHPPCPP